MRQSKSLIIIGMLGLGLMLSTSAFVAASPGEAKAKSSLDAYKVQTIELILVATSFNVTPMVAHVEIAAPQSIAVALEVLNAVKSEKLLQGSKNVRSFSNSVTLYKQVTAVPIDISPGAKLYLDTKLTKIYNLTPKLCNSLTLSSFNRKLESKNKVEFKHDPYVYRDEIPLRV